MKPENSDFFPTSTPLAGAAAVPDVAPKVKPEAEEAGPGSVASGCPAFQAGGFGNQRGGFGSQPSGTGFGQPQTQPSGFQGFGQQQPAQPSGGFGGFSAAPTPSPPPNPAFGGMQQGQFGAGAASFGVPQQQVPQAGGFAMGNTGNESTRGRKILRAKRRFPKRS